MKILMALMGLDIGGAETHVMELASELHRRGHEVIIASAGGAYVPVLEARGVRHTVVPMNRRSVKDMARSLGMLRRLIREEKPDLVHAHARIPAFLCGRLQKKMGFPFLTTAHWVFTVTPLLRRMTDWGQRTVAVSEDIKDYLMHEYQVPADQIHVTINGIDTEEFGPGRREEALRQALGLGNGPVVCHVSRLDASRSLAAEQLLAVWPGVLETFPDAQLLLVGGGDRQQTLETLAGEINRTAGRNTVVMTGPRTDIAALVSLGDVFVGASRAVLEAMSEEKPVIMAGNEGYLGLFRPEKLAEAMDTNFCYRGAAQVTPEALLADLKDLLAMSPGEKQELGEAGRRAVLENYSVAKMTDDYLLAYDRLLHGLQPLRTVISGYYGYDNLGDDAILLAISRQLSGFQRPVRLTVLSRDPGRTAARFGVKAVPRFSPLSVFSALRKSDLLISGGGSLLQDRTSTRSLRYYLAVIHLARLLKKPVILLSNGIGPLDSPGSRKLVRRCVSKCELVTLRDEDSKALLREIGVEREDLIVTADPAFSLRAKPGGREILDSLGVPADRPLVGVSVRKVAGRAGDPGAFASLCDRITRETGSAVVFLAMQEPSDREYSDAIRQRMAEASWTVSIPGDPEAMLGVISCMGAVVSMRLHTIIFAAEQRVPVVGCVYDPKVDAFLKLLHMPSCGTAEALDHDAAVEAVKYLLAIDDREKQHLEDTVRAMERQTMELDEMLERFLDSHIA